MKKFRYRFTKLVTALFIVALLLAVVCLVFNTLRLINDTNPSTSQFISFGAITVVSVLIIVLAIAALVSSYYIVSEKKLILRWGILKDEIQMKSITKIARLERSDKMIIYYNTQNYFRVSISNDIYFDFIAAIREYNSNVVFEVVEEYDDKKK